ncbi:MAG: hypothetical protein U5L00_13570 [Desulfovermiculus sp.]|nr:hypothetical protein [Desulfovermiculus sp.]
MTGATETPAKERLIDIELQDQKLRQALNSIAGHFDILIHFHGETPQYRRDIFLTQASLKQAISKIMRAYGIQNHVAAYDPETGDIMLAVLELGSTDADLRNEKSEKDFKLQMSSMTADEFSKLIRSNKQQLRGITEDEYAELMPTALEDMRAMGSDEYAELEPSSEENLKGMSPDELFKLKPTSFENMRSMTVDEYEALTQDN